MVVNLVWKSHHCLFLPFSYFISGLSLQTYLYVGDQNKGGVIFSKFNILDCLVENKAVHLLESTPRQKFMVFIIIWIDCVPLVIIWKQSLIWSVCKFEVVPMKPILLFSLVFLFTYCVDLNNVFFVLDRRQYLKAFAWVLLGSFLKKSEQVKFRRRLNFFQILKWLSPEFVLNNPTFNNF